MGVLNGGRIGIASQALGIATGAYEFSIEIFARAQSFGKKF
jgi:alkylation response protein AidB-like acyl-CoA dehydrogenase